MTKLCAWFSGGGLSIFLAVPVWAAEELERALQASSLEGFDTAPWVAVGTMRFGLDGRRSSEP